ncbi:MAG: hypothetical protein K6T75_09970 [Acetobacteraceae bacterium]|nr:hypothetical protein [Acetobacteraceae bacterium]
MLCRTWRAVAVALVVCVVGMVLAGCSPASSPRLVVTSFFTALQRGRYAAASALVENAGEAQFPSENDPASRMLKAYFSRLRYKVLSTEIDGSQATVHVRVTLPDLAGILVRLPAEGLFSALAGASGGQSPAAADAAVLRLFEGAFKDPKSPTVTTEIPIGLKKVGGKWLIVGDEWLAAALMGGAAEVLEKAFGTGP